MKILSKIIFFLILILFSSYLDSRAEIVFLKSGKVVEGKILQKKPNGNIKVDVGGVPIEYFYNEILGVKENNYKELIEGMYSRGLESPDKVVADYCSAMLDEDVNRAYSHLTKRKYDMVKDVPLNFIDKKNERWNSVKSFQVIRDDILGKKAVVKVLYKVGQRTFGQTFILIKEDKHWKIDDYDYKNEDLKEEGASSFKGSLASVSGHIKFPDVSNHGKLLVVFLPYEDVTAKGRSVFLTLSINEDMLLKNSNIIPYKVDNVYPGTYKGFVVWDVNAPFLTKAFEQKGSFDFKGDYLADVDPVKIDDNTSLNDVDFQLRLF